VSFSVKRGVRAVTCAVSMAAVSSMLVAGQALGTGGGGESFNNVGINISGGDAVAVSACLNIAKLKADQASKTNSKGKQKPTKVFQSNFCKNVAVSKGGDVTLKNVDLTILQADGSKKSVNNATINITGGDATAVAACVNYAAGADTVVQDNTCKNASFAKGGDVTLKNVSIFVVQES